MPTVKDVIVKKPSDAESATCSQWPIWEHEPDSFDWDYTQKETCLLIEGEATVSDGESSVTFKAGEMVVFPEDLICKWTITKAVKKYYNFG